MATDSAPYTHTLGILGPILRPIPLIGSSLASVVAVAIELRNIHLMRMANADALKEIADRAELLSGSIAQSRQAAGDHAQTLSPLVEELHEVVEKTKRRADELRFGGESPPSCCESLFPCFRLFAQDKALRSLRKEMDSAFRRFSTEAQIVILSDLAEIRSIISGLQNEHQAGSFDSLRAALRPMDDALYTAHSAPTGCTEGTRQRLLSEIMADVTQSDAQHAMYWISGLAGTGKSAIARSLCDRLGGTQNLHLLTFYLSASSVPRHDAIGVVHTLAFYLTRAFPQLLRPLWEAIRQHDGALARPVQEQAKLLLEETISRLTQCSEVLVIVVDAVDILAQEPTGRDDRQLLSALIAFARAAPIRIRIIVTGRPTRALRDFFSTPPSSDAPPLSTRVLRLEDVELFEVKQDIRTYLRSTFADISARHPTLCTTGWPLETDIEALAARSSGVFLYASAAARCLELPGSGGPEHCLHGLLHGGAAYSALCASLDDVYSDIIRRVISPPVSPALKDQARDLLGSLIIIDPRLSIPELALLLGYQAAEVQGVMDSFYAVVIPGDLPSIFHPTFSEFLQDITRCHDPRLAVDVPLQHSKLAAQCLGLVCSSVGNNRGALAQGRIANLAADLCRLASSRAHTARLYAFRYWPRHLLQAANVTTELTQALTQFTEGFLLSWVDIMLEFETRASVETSIHCAAQWCENHPELASIAEGLRRILREEGPVPFSSPVQLVPDLPPHPAPIPESQSVYSLVSLSRLASATLLPSSTSDFGERRADEEGATPHSPYRNASSSDGGNRDDAPSAPSVAVSLHHDSDSEFEATFHNADSAAVPDNGVAPAAGMHIDGSPVTACSPAAQHCPSNGIANNQPHDTGARDEALARLPPLPRSRPVRSVNGDSD